MSIDKSSLFAFLVYLSFWDLPNNSTTFSHFFWLIVFIYEKPKDLYI
jgi:hypothetical protein